MHIGAASCIYPATAALLKLCLRGLPLILLTLLLAWRASAVADWIRAAWILRKLDRPSGNIVYSGVRRLLTGKRLRVMQAVNETVVGGRGVFYYNILWGHMVVVSEPRIVAELLHDTSLAKPTQPVMVHFRQLMSPDGRADFLSAEGDSEDWLWRTVRRGVAPAFAPTALRAAYPKLAQVGARLTEILQNRPQQEAIDMCNVCMCETIDALGLAGFNKAFNSIEAITQGQQADLLHVIYTANEEVARGLYNPAYKLWQMLPGPRSKGQLCMQRFQTIMQNLLQELKARGPPADDDDSLAAHLLRIRDPGTGQLLSDDWLLPQISVTFWAGFDTTGNTMAWTLYCISQHPEVERKIAAELREHGLLAVPDQPFPRGPDYADLDKLTLWAYPLCACPSTRTCWLTMAAYSFPATPQSGSLWACRMPAQPSTKMLINSYRKDGWNHMQSTCPLMGKQLIRMVLQEESAASFHSVMASASVLAWLLPR
ncbi:TPA: hypothetical protein ACH3X1_013234 [Trebouxia sp. C0004]